MSQELDPKDMARVLSFGRIAIGLGAVLAPRRFGKGWTGEEHEDDALSSMAVRGLGARDVALGVGTLLALESGGPVKGWVEAQALADASDTVSTLLNFGRLPKLRALVMLASAGGACYYGVKIAAELD